ncbi:hypothetical protein ACFVTC_36950 [Streptomyces sp. NPDC057950]|uniref:hypothetical protein n=1 Tax=Streptomyces sp. NPDC057950 TaxID=3346288 RepID=UPI0036E6CC0D
MGYAARHRGRCVPGRAMRSLHRLLPVVVITVFCAVLPSVAGGPHTARGPGPRRIRVSWSRLLPSGCRLWLSGFSNSAYCGWDRARRGTPGMSGRSPAGRRIT